MRPNLSRALIAIVTLALSCSDNSDSPSSGDAGKLDAGADASPDASPDAGPDALSCALSCQESVETYCAKNTCMTTWPGDPKLLCGLGAGFDFWECGAEFVASFLNVDFRTTFTYDKTSSSLLSVTTYNANMKTSFCVAGPAQIEFPCAGDETCTPLTVDCADAAAPGDADVDGD